MIQGSWDAGQIATYPHLLKSVISARCGVVGKFYYSYIIT